MRCLALKFQEEAGTCPDLSPPLPQHHTHETPVSQGEDGAGNKGVFVPWLRGWESCSLARLHFPAPQRDLGVLPPASHLARPQAQQPPKTPGQGTRLGRCAPGRPGLQAGLLGGASPPPDLGWCRRKGGGSCSCRGWRRLGWVSPGGVQALGPSCQPLLQTLWLLFCIFPFHQPCTGDPFFLPPFWHFPPKPTLWGKL